MGARARPSLRVAASQVRHSSPSVIHGAGRILAATARRAYGQTAPQAPDWGPWRRGRSRPCHGPVPFRRR